MSAYLYELENTLYRPQKTYTHDKTTTAGYFTPHFRSVLLEWMFGTAKILKLHFPTFPHSVMLLDTYMSLTPNTTKDDTGNWQGIACMCMHLSTTLLEYYTPEMSDWNYITDGAYTYDQFAKIREDIMIKLNGQLIRPAPIFFVDVDNEDFRENSWQGKDADTFSLLRLTCFANNLFEYPPSLICATVVYLLTGKTNERYTLENMGEPCQKIVELVVGLTNSSNKDIKERAEYFKDMVFRGCSERHALLQSTTFKAISTKDFKGYTKQKGKLGEGAFAAVKKIEKDGQFYAVKHFGRGEVIAEIAILSLLKTCKSSIITIEGFLMDLPDTDEFSAFVFVELAKFNLEEAITKKLVKTDEKHMWRYFGNLLAALKCLEHFNVIHGDIKAPNIVVNGDADNAHLKLIDFGSSLAYSSFRRDKPIEFGTLLIRAPELLEAGVNATMFFDYTTKVDIWSMGIVFYFMIAGVNPLTAPWNIFVHAGRRDYGKLLLDAINMVFVQGADNVKKDLGVYYPLVNEMLQIDPNKRASIAQLDKCVDKHK